MRVEYALITMVRITTKSINLLKRRNLFALSSDTGPNQSGSPLERDGLTLFSSLNKL